MKDFIEKISDSLYSTCKEAADQTQKTLDQTKYRTEIVSLKGEIKKLYQRLGEECYRNYINDVQKPCSIPVCNRITAIKREIEILEKRIDIVTNSQKDSFDSYKRDVRTTWNDEMTNETPVQKNEEGIQLLRFCSKCNTGNPHKGTYCINCGNKL